MVGKTLVPESLANSTQSAPLDEERRAAHAISSLIEQVDDSVLWIVIKIFAAARDKRVKRGGCLFIAHLLRFSTLVQLSLFQGTEISDAARIAIPNILKFCKNRANGWPWCYDTTLKYLDLLIWAGVLVTRPDEPGVYYLPLNTYVLLPEYAARQVEKLAGKRSKVSRSAAFKRTAVHCTLLGDGKPVGDAWMVDSPKGALVIDEQEMQQLVQALGAALQNCQGIALLPTTIVAMTRVVAKHAPRVLKKDGRFFAREKTQLFLQAPSSADEQRLDGMADSRLVGTSSTSLQGGQLRADGRENLLSGMDREREGSGKSTRSAANLPVGTEMVDSPAAALSDITIITTNKDTFSEYILSENADEREGNLGRESTIAAKNSQVVDLPEAGEATADVPAHPLADAFSHATLLYWRFPQAVQEREPGMTEQSHLAALLSYHYNRDDQKVGHYMKLLKQDHRALDIAIIDGLVRSHFPDPRHKPDTLKGPWVTRQYKAYRAGEQVPDEILAWADTPYTYDAINSILAEAACWQEAQGQPRRRPRPDDVIVDSDGLDDDYFWANYAGQGLKSEGWAGVNVDGDLMTCDQYEQHRLLLLQRKLEQREFDTDPRTLSPEVEAEFLAYHAWISPWVCSVEEEQQMREHLPAELLDNLEALGWVLDHERYAVEVGITPLSRKRVVAVSLRDDFRQAWLLRDGSDFRAFEQLCRQSQQDGERRERSAGRDWLPEDDAAALAQEQSVRQATGGEPMETRPDLQVGPYRVAFDTSGATIEVEREGTTVGYRVESTTATNATDLIRIHRKIVIAIANDRPEDLEAYRLERQVEEGNRRNPATEE